MQVVFKKLPREEKTLRVIFGTPSGEEEALRVVFGTPLGEETLQHIIAIDGRNMQLHFKVK